MQRLLALISGRSVVAAVAAASLACALSALGSAAPASFPADAPTGGLVAAYAFNEGSGTTTADASGGGNTGTLSNATWTSAGKYGAALSFNGTNARVNIPNAASLQLTTGMTLEAWVNPSTVSNKWRDVVYKGNDNYYLEATSNKSSRPAGGGTFGGGNANVFGTAALATNTWVFLALTYDGANLRLYVNGTLAGTQPKTGTIATSTNQLQIGGDSLQSQFFNGLIDDVRVYNIALSAAAIQTDMATPIGGSADTQPPTVPGTLGASVVNAGEIDLAWGAATDNVGVTGYQVWRCQGAGCTNFALLTQTSGTGTTFKDQTVAASTSYSYQVRAFDAASNNGPFSNTASGTTPASADTQPPTVPGTLGASVVNAGEIDLAWGAATDNVGVTGYQVWRCQGAGCTNFALLTQTSGTGTTFKDQTVAASTSYSYQVRAFDAAGNLGPFSNTASGTTPASADTQPPTVPGTLGASVVNAGEIDLAWGAATDNVGVTGYQVWRCQGAGCTNFALLTQTSGTGTTFKDQTVAASTSYSYQVRAFDAASNIGPFSNTALGHDAGERRHAAADGAGDPAARRS